MVGSRVSVDLSELKQVSIKQCLGQPLRYRSMLASIPFGIGVDIDKSFRTRRLVDHLALLGFSNSSDDLKLLKQFATVSDSMEVTETEHFTQWTGDNVDQNIQTMTGKGKYRDTGINSICCNSNSNFKAISRRQHKSVTNSVDCGVKVEPYYVDSCQGLQKLYFLSMANLASTTLSVPGMTLDLLLHTTWFFTSRGNPHPN